MTAFELAGYAVSSAVAHLPRLGVWSADVVLQEAPALVAGDRATLTLGDLSLTGTLRPGGAFAGVGSWHVVGGAGRWDAQVPRRDYRDDGGVMLSRVLQDLVLEAGEVGASLDVADRSLGISWVRPAGLASDALRALAGDAWYVGADGVTHVGARPASSVSSALLTVSSYDPATGRAVVRVADTAVAALASGATLTADGLPGPLLIGDVIVRASPGDVAVELYGQRGPAELLGALVQALSSGARYAPHWPATVAEASAGRASVKPADARAIQWPEAPILPQGYGVPGVTATLQQGASVLVAFPAGDPGSPVILGYLPGVLPLSLSLSAADGVSVAPGTGKIDLGGTQDLALGPLVDARIEALRVAVNALGAAVPALGTVRAQKVRGA